MKHIAAAFVVTLVALAGFGAGSALAADWKPYTGPGEWFPPGRSASSSYDYCAPWISNTFAKSPSGWGLITFIDVNGNWSYGKQGNGTIRRELTLSVSRTWVKKPFCKNNSGFTYQGGCFGFVEPQQCA
ncbi:MAG: hypothetical protein ACRDOF_07085 [Gaiellaceae bacterium]